jgi:hypothetical protein
MSDVVAMENYISLLRRLDGDLLEENKLATTSRVWMFGTFFKYGVSG